MRNYASLDEILDEAAAGADLRRYLDLRGIKTIGTLALVASDEEMLQRTIVDPILAGYTSGTDRIAVSDPEKPIVRAVLLHAWSLAKASWNKTMGATTVTPAATAATPAASTGSATSETKVPRTLPSGKWSALVETYNKVTLHGRERQFPVRELLGAECVIARLWHERHVSRQYTPLQLGEILQHRSFSASGDINPLARNPRKTSVLSLDEDKQLIEADDPTWTPRSLIGVLDGLHAAKWAYILVQLGDEMEISEFIDLMTLRARNKPDKMAQFVTYRHAAMWRVAMDMRSGDAFGVAAKKMTDDLAFYHDYMAKEPLVDKTKLNKALKVTEVPDRGPIKHIKGDKGGKAGKGSQSSDRWQPYSRSRWQEQSQWRQYGSQWQNRGQQQQYWRGDHSSQQSWNDKPGK